MIINPWIFYLIGVCDAINIVFTIICIVSCIFLLAGLFIFALVYCDNCDDKSYLKETMKIFNKFFKKVVIAFVISFLGMTFIPSKEIATKMLIASQVNETNVEHAKEVADYIVGKIQEVKE